MYHNSFLKPIFSKGSPLVSIQKDLSDVLESLLDYKTNTLSEGDSWYQPSTSISDNKSYYEVSLELPGVEQKDIQISLDKNTLTISGEKKKEEQVKDNKYYRTERYFGKFTRSFEFPENVNQDRVDAVFKNGILSIKIDKNLEADVKKIEIRNS